MIVCINILWSLQFLHSIIDINFQRVFRTNCQIMNFDESDRKLFQHFNDWFFNNEKHNTLGLSLRLFFLQTLIKINNVNRWHIQFFQSYKLLWRQTVICDRENERQRERKSEKRKSTDFTIVPMSSYRASSNVLCMCACGNVLLILSMHIEFQITAARNAGAHFMYAWNGGIKPYRSTDTLWKCTVYIICVTSILCTLHTPHRCRSINHKASK